LGKAPPKFIELEIIGGVYHITCPMVPIKDTA